MTKAKRSSDPRDPRVGKQRMSRELGIIKTRRRAVAPPSAPDGVQLERVQVVLVRTQFAGNVGQVARAMLNMGLTRLVLVAPEAKWRSSEARRPAVGAWEVIKEARVVDSLDEALEGCGMSLAFTAGRGREARIRPEPVEDLLDRLVEVSAERDVALVFGSEVDGLTNEEIARCDVATRLQVSPTFASLNLAQAVLLASAQVFAHRRALVRPERDPPPTDEERERFYRLVFRVLARTGFVPKQRMPRFRHSVRRIFGKLSLEDWEQRLLHGIFAQMEGCLEHPERILPLEAADRAFVEGRDLPEETATEAEPQPQPRDGADATDA